MPPTDVASTAAPTVSDSEIYERLVSAILDHKLPPGTKLVEDKLASAFGVRAVFFLCAALAWILTGAGKWLLGTERHAAAAPA